MLFCSRLRTRARSPSSLCGTSARMTITRQPPASPLHHSTTGQHSDRGGEPSDTVRDGRPPAQVRLWTKGWAVSADSRLVARVQQFEPELPSFEGHQHRAEV